MIWGMWSPVRVTRRRRSASIGRRSTNIVSFPKALTRKWERPCRTWACCLSQNGKPKEAEPFIREGLALRRKVLGDAHPDTAASFLRVADLLYAEGDYTGAEQAARESIAVYGRALAHPTEGIFSSSPLHEVGPDSEQNRPLAGGGILYSPVACHTHAPSGPRESTDRGSARSLGRMSDHAETLRRGGTTSVGEL